jgi:hypothetical protein
MTRRINTEFLINRGNKKPLDIPEAFIIELFRIYFFFFLFNQIPPSIKPKPIILAIIGSGTAKGSFNPAGTGVSGADA